MELRIRRETVNIHNGLENFTILHISDIHIWYSYSILAKLELEIANIKPDLVVMTGDYYDTPLGAILIRKFIKSVSSEIQIIFITGNHDHIYGKKVSDKLLNIQNAIRIDNNSHIFISKTGYQYNFISQNAIKNLNPNYSNILLIHNPEYIIDNNLKDISELQVIYCPNKNDVIHIWVGKRLMVSYKVV